MIIYCCTESMNRVEGKMDNRKIGIVAILAFSVFTAFSAIPSVQASIIYVPDDYTTIQSAVDAAFPGDTIIVGSGTYKDNVIMDKKLTLIGDAFATIDAQGKGGAINISADYCVVTGFRCVNAKSAGIKVESHWNRIENNTCEKNNYGICLNDSSNNTISNNTVLNNKYGISLHHPPSPGLVEVRVNTPEYVEEKETFDVTIDVEGITDFNSGMFYLTFDHKVVKVDDVTDGRIDDTEIPVTMWVYMDSDTTGVMLELPETTTASGSGYLAKITFKVKGDEGEESELNLSNGVLVGITFTDSVPVLEELSAKWIDAKIRVVSEEEEGEKKEEEGEKAGIQVGSHNNFISKNTISNNGYGIYLVSSSNNTLMNNIVSLNNRDGFYMKDSSNNTIKKNEAYENKDHGIYLKRSSNNEIKNNEIHKNNDNGIHVYDSTNSMIASNEIYNNNDDGIYLRCSGNSTLTENIISGNEHNFAVYGKYLSDYLQNIDASNKVEGKPVYYLVNKKNQRIPTDAGYVGIVNSTNITMNDLTLTNNSQGVLIAFSSNSKIENVNVLNNKYGIYLDHASDNVLMNNKVANNNDDGIYMYDASNNNTIQNNEIRENDDDGIYLQRSTNNDIRDNEIHENKEDGICLSDSSNNTIQNNEICENKEDGICLYDSSNNTIQNNEIRENMDDGIYLKRSTNTEITDNEIHENRDKSISTLHLYSSNITNNNCSNNKYGIHLWYSNNNFIYLNNFINNTDNVHSYKSTNLWNSTKEITYTYNGTTYESYLGNFWDDYTGTDRDGDGIGDTPYNINKDSDNYPLMAPWDNYFASKIISLLRNILVSNEPRRS